MSSSAGGIGLLVFALLVRSFARTPAVVVMSVATAGWLLVSGLLRHVRKRL